MCFVIPAQGKWGQEDPWGSLACQSNQTNEPQVPEIESVSKIKVDGA